MRNKVIVRECRVLVASPSVVQDRAPRNSGTWFTVDYAREIKRPVIIVYPSGRTVGEGKWREAGTESVRSSH